MLIFLLCGYIYLKYHIRTFFTSFLRQIQLSKILLSPDAEKNACRTARAFFSKCNVTDPPKASAASSAPLRHKTETVEPYPSVIADAFGELHSAPFLHPRRRRSALLEFCPAYRLVGRLQGKCRSLIAVRYLPRACGNRGINSRAVFLSAV